MRLLAFFLLLISTTALSAQPAGLQSRSALVLHSYQQGPAWVQNITDGILSVFKQSRDFNYVYRFEYMNILDADPSTYPEIYRRRLGSLHFDVVVGVDNQALEFLIENRAELFAGVPIVFCSVDDYTEDMLEGESDVTGVTGELDFEGTIRLARRLHPDMNHLVVLANRSLAVESAAYAVLEELIREKFRDQIEIEYWEDPKLSEVLERAGSFPPDSVIFDMAFLADEAARGLQRSTLALYFGEIRSLFAHFVRRGWIVRSPCASIQPPRFRRKPVQPVSMATITAILAAAHQPARTYLLLLLGSGMRSCELCNLRREDIDFERGTIRLHGKGDKERYVAPGRAALAALREVVNGQETAVLSFGEYMKENNWIVAFGYGYGELVKALPLVSFALAAFFGIVTIKTFVLTTLDTAVRVTRYVISEVLGETIGVFRNRWVATVLSVAPAFYLGFTGAWKSIWPVFGAANQLIAALALFIVSTYLLGVRRPTRYTVIPGVFMLVTTVAALGFEVYAFLTAEQPNYVLAGVAAVLILLALFVVREVALAFAAQRRRRVEGAPAPTAGPK